MAKELFDKSKIGIPCPNCGEQTEKTIAWIKANDHFTCAECGSVITLERDQLLDGLKKADKALSDLRASFKRLSKRP